MRFCAKCNRVVDGRCGQCDKRTNKKTTNENGYDSTWKRMSENIRKQRPLCEDCLHDGRVVASASVTVSGDDNNIVTFAYPSAVTDEIGQFRYALRDEAAPKTVYSQGLLLVKAAANKD